MNSQITINPIGHIRAKNGAFYVALEDKVLPALTNLSGFSHLQLLWWGHLNADTEQRGKLIEDKPYKHGPDKIGVFATRSPMRPNPILVTTVFVQHIDFAKGIIQIPYIDADDGTPVLDIKPYHKSERVRECTVPEWCAHWPEWYENAGAFDWADEFNF